MVNALIQTIKTAIELNKCRHCGCMRESLEEIKERLEGTDDPQFYPLFCEVGIACEKLENVEYA